MTQIYVTSKCPAAHVPCPSSQVQKELEGDTSSHEACPTSGDLMVVLIDIVLMPCRDFPNCKVLMPCDEGKLNHHLMMGPASHPSDPKSADGKNSAPTRSDADLLLTNLDMRINATMEEGKKVKSQAVQVLRPRRGLSVKNKLHSSETQKRNDSAIGHSRSR